MVSLRVKYFQTFFKNDHFLKFDNFLKLDNFSRNFKDINIFSLLDSLIYYKMEKEKIDSPRSMKS